MVELDDLRDGFFRAAAHLVQERSERRLRLRDLLSDGIFAYTYDAEGNRATKTEIATGNVTTYSWDYRNRLIGVTVVDAEENIISEAHFTYDVFNNLIIRDIDADGDGVGEAVVMATVYNGIHPWADFDGEGNLLQHYIYGQAVDQVMARIDAENNLDWYLTDNLGSVRQIVDDVGTILDETDFDSFGNILSETEPLAGDRFKFPGREREAQVDLYFNRLRWYDPSDGRFISEDPIGFASGDSNVYRYVFNQPTIATDPEGLRGGGGVVVGPAPSPTTQWPAHDRWCPPDPLMPEPIPIPPPHTRLPPSYPEVPWPSLEPRPGSADWELYAKTCWSKTKCERDPARRILQMVAPHADRWDDQCLALVNDMPDGSDRATAMTFCRLASNYYSNKCDGLWQEFHRYAPGSREYQLGEQMYRQLCPAGRFR